MEISTTNYLKHILLFLKHNYDKSHIFPNTLNMSIKIFYILFLDILFVKTIT